LQCGSAERHNGLDILVFRSGPATEQINDGPGPATPEVLRSQRSRPVMLYEGEDLTHQLGKTLKEALSTAEAIDLDESREDPEMVRSQYVKDTMKHTAPGLWHLVTARCTPTGGPVFGVALSTENGVAAMATCGQTQYLVFCHTDGLEDIKGRWITEESVQLSTRVLYMMACAALTASFVLEKEWNPTCYTVASFCFLFAVLFKLAYKASYRGVE